MRREKNTIGNIIFGPVLVLVALSALWKNETRFDYHRAATVAPVVASPAEAPAGETIALTGTMDPALTLDGEYVASFTGFLVVRRWAEIYAWDRSESDDRVSWDLEWMSVLESNDRNAGLSQELSSRRFLPPEYVVGDLTVSAELIEFVDDSSRIDPGTLDLVWEDLQVEGDAFVLRKGQPDNLGDERVTYSAIPVPATATYFGRFDGERGVADTSQRRTGFVNGLIRDSGILHHIVAGEREVALGTMKAHLFRLKWIVRGIGTVLVVLGFLIFFRAILGVLLHIPLLGALVAGGAFLASVAIGLPLALITIVAGLLAANPLVPAVVVALVAAGVIVVRVRGKASQAAVKHQLDERYGRALTGDDLKDLEFMALARLAMADGEISAEEQRRLRVWAKRHRWDPAKADRMMAEARQGGGEGGDGVPREQQLRDLVAIAMADGTVSPQEMKSIRAAAERSGHGESKINQLMQSVRRSAQASPA
jgi:tellurite resistance protein